MQYLLFHNIHFNRISNFKSKMSQIPPAYSDTPEVDSTAPPLESDLVPRDTKQLLEGCPPLSVTHQPQTTRTQDPRGIPLPPWSQDCTWNSPVTTRVSLPTEQTAQESSFNFATKPLYFQAIIVLACLSMCFSLPIGLFAFIVALCAYCQFTNKKYNLALALSWVASALGVASVIMSILAVVAFYKLYYLPNQHSSYSG